MTPDKLQEHFDNIDLKLFDNTKIKGATIENAQKFVENHVNFIRSNSGIVTFLGYWDRLIEFYNITKTKTK